MDRTLKLELATAIVANIVIIKRKINARNRKGRLRSRAWLEDRRNRGALNMLNKELRVEDPLSYRNFLRVSSSQLEDLLSLISSDITKQNTFMRDAVPAQNRKVTVFSKLYGIINFKNYFRLEVTLRFLATGESYRSLMYLTRIHESTISRFVPEVCLAIYNNLKSHYLQV